MSSINPISGIQWPAMTGGVTGVGSGNGSAGAGGVGGSPTSSNFADALKDAFEKVDAQQQDSTMAIQDLMTGKTQDALPVVEAVAKADLSFKLLMGVRNKVIEAYKQTMNMQV